MTTSSGDVSTNPKYDKVETGPSSKSKEQQERDEYGFCGCWEWFKADPLSRKTFLFWIIFALATFLFMIVFLVSKTGGYILTGVAVLIVTGYGWNHFRILMALKESIDRYSNLNKQFKSENESLNTEVDRLNKAKLELQTVEGDLKEGNKRLEDSLVKFKQLDSNLQSLGGNNLEGMKFIQDKSKKMMDDWRSNLIQQEKDLISEVFDRFEMKDDKEDMNREEFNQFLDALPKKYQLRTRQLSLNFDKVAGDDQILNLDEFQQMLDVWVEKGIDIMLDEEKEN